MTPAIIYSSQLLFISNHNLTFIVLLNRYYLGKKEKYMTLVINIVWVMGILQAIRGVLASLQCREASQQQPEPSNPALNSHPHSPYGQSQNPLLLTRSCSRNSE